VTYTLIKVFVSAGVLVAVAEIAQRNSALGALLASLPLTSLLAFLWLYRDTGEVEKVAALSHDIFWLVQGFLADVPATALAIAPRHAVLRRAGREYRRHGCLVSRGPRFAKTLRRALADNGYATRNRFLCAFPMRRLALLRVG
jgi:hypothetical protein